MTDRATPDRAAAPSQVLDDVDTGSVEPITTPLAERLRALMAKATPGPLEMYPDDRNGQAVIGGPHIEIATFWHHCVGSIEDEMRANAALILILVNNLPTLLAALDGREAGNSEQREAWAYLWRWVERGLFDRHSDPRSALEVMLFHPSAPWNNGEWDVSHKSYAEAFYTKFPKARPQPAGEPE